MTLRVPLLDDEPTAKSVHDFAVLLVKAAIADEVKAIVGRDAETVRVRGDDLTPAQADRHALVEYVRSRADVLGVDL